MPPRRSGCLANPLELIEIGGDRSARLGGCLLALVAAVLLQGALGTAAASAAGPSLGLGSALPADVIAASAAPGSTWTPQPAVYGVGETPDVPVTMSDGAVLRADIYFPTNSTGKQAAGRFPVLLTQTPYGKDTLGSAASTSVIGSQSGPDEYLVKRGFIDVVADVRGTGDSQGSFGFFDPVQQTDAVTLVKWASKLSGSDGKVGLYGGSYLGIDQLLTAGAEPRHSPLKAIFPVVPGNDLYKDTATMGGLIDIEFDLFYVGLTSTLNVEGPFLDAVENPTHALADLNPTVLQHLSDLGSFDATFAAQTLLGQAPAFDGAYWQARNPVNALAKIVANKIPAYIVGGEYDLFQRGEPLDYSGLQNAYARRSVIAPMLPDQHATGRYQLLDGPFTHLGAVSYDYDPLMLEWFDTWLKGQHTGMAATPTPLHYFDLGTHTYTEHAQYPFPDAVPTRYYFNDTRSSSSTLLGNSGSLTTTPAPPSTNTLLWSPVGNPCGPFTDQWIGGIPGLATDLVSPDTPCVNTDRVGQASLDQLTFTTKPLATAQTIAGPIDVTVDAKATTTQTEWVAEVDDIAPDGTITPLTEGALLGSLRAAAPATTWTTSSGQILQAGHTYSQNDATPVIPGKITRYDIDVFPTYATIAAGHRIRITLATADTPHLLPTIPDTKKLLGGIYTIQNGGPNGSAVELPLIPAA